ncbi:MAG TPA: L,D-transpeptidase [Chloroflexia bacterium]|nr:L,D-transpeptidase [Chloroflexia bacterium]
MKGIFAVLSSKVGRCILAGLLAGVLVSSSFGGSAYATPLGSGQASVPGSTGASPAARTYKWIDIDLSSQRLRAYAGNTLIYSTLISSGTSRYPTVKGTFRVYSKIRSQRMRGGTGRDRYDLPNVPHVMYFYGAYAIHGAYWHHNFGRPMSHGCVNLPLGIAGTLYNWTPMGTTVVVHW